MYKFTIPDSIVFFGAVYKFSDFFEFLVDNVPEFKTSLSSLRSGMRLLDSLASATGEFVTEEDKAFSLVKKTLDSEEFCLPVITLQSDDKSINQALPSRLLIKFCDAISNAEKHDKDD